MGSFNQKVVKYQTMFWLLLVPSLLTLAESKDPDLSTSTTWRCGVFIPLPDEKFQEPLAKYFVFHRKFQAKCPAKLFYTFSKGAFSKKCSKLGQQWERIWSPGKQRLPGKKYGDEVCEILSKEVGMENVPNEVFPDGVKFGFFYNYCGLKKWKDTAVRSEKSVCCQNGKYKSCDAFDTESASTIEESPEVSANEISPVNIAEKVEIPNKKVNKNKGRVDLSKNDSLPSEPESIKESEKVDISNEVEKEERQELSLNGSLPSEPESIEKPEKVVIPNETVEKEERQDLTLTDSLKSELPIIESDDGGIDALKEKLEKGDKLNDEEVKEVKQFVFGLKISASQLLKVAKEFEDLLKKKTSV